MTEHPDAPRFNRVVRELLGEADLAALDRYREELASRRGPGSRLAAPRDPADGRRLAAPGAAAGTHCPGRHRPGARLGRAADHQPSRRRDPRLGAGAHRRRPRADDRLPHGRHDRDTRCWCPTIPGPSPATRSCWSRRWRGTAWRSPRAARTWRASSWAPRPAPSPTPRPSPPGATRGFAKLNLRPTEWPRPDSPGRYLGEMAPRLLTGDPISFAELLRLDVKVRPLAAVSTAVAMSVGLRQRLSRAARLPRRRLVLAHRDRSHRLPLHHGRGVPSAAPRPARRGS